MYVHFAWQGLPEMTYTVLGGPLKTILTHSWSVVS